MTQSAPTHLPPAFRLRQERLEACAREVLSARPIRFTGPCCGQRCNVCAYAEPERPAPAAFVRIESGASWIMATHLCEWCWDHVEMIASAASVPGALCSEEAC